MELVQTFWLYVWFLLLKNATEEQKFYFLLDQMTLKINK